MKRINLNFNRVVAAPLDRVWNIVSDVDNDTKYYNGMSEIKNVSREGNKIERELTVGFFKHKARQTIILKPKSAVEAVMTEGPLRGTRITSLNPVNEENTYVNIVWDVSPSGIPSFVHDRVEKELSDGTKDALEKIAAQAEQASTLANSE